jgi:hypothetical protein
MSSAARRLSAAVVLAIGLPGASATAAADDAGADWIVRPDGTRFRVRFDPGQRLLLGAAADVRAASAGPARAAPAFEVGLLLRSPPPPVGWEIAWRPDQEVAHLRLGPGGGGAGMAADGVLYRGLFLRRSRAGTVTLPLSPPVALPLPFDIGLLAEVGRFEGALPAPGTVGIVHGEVVADFWRSARAGCWLLAGVGARYDAGLARDDAGQLTADHRIAPMTALSVAAHAQRGDGLIAGGARVEAARRWSSARGWEEALRVEGELEAIPLAVNDRPLSLFAAASGDAAGGLSGSEWRLVVGARVSAPLR